jgi:hypothetical protein
MIDVIQELYDEFPELEPKAIDKICKDGLTGINKLLRSGEELIIQAEGREVIKFYIPCTPEAQDALLQTNRRRRYYKALKQQHGEKSTK